MGRWADIHGALENVRHGMVIKAGVRLEDEALSFFTDPIMIVTMNIWETTGGGSFLEGVTFIVFHIEDG